MDTDINSIENARNDNYTLRVFNKIRYSKGLGPGTYDVYSHVVPSVKFVKEKVENVFPCVEVNRL